MAVPATVAEAHPVHPPKVQVLSNRADLVSGGNALVAIKSHRAPRVTLIRDPDGNPTRIDVTERFSHMVDGKRVGLVKKLANGENLLVVKAQHMLGTAEITNHPRGGPVFSGPQIKPWVCQEGAKDAKCNQKPVREFFYRPEGQTTYEPYDPQNPQDDVAMTTTDEGETVPFIIRQETGYMDRDQYRIATLYTPGERWKPWAPQSHWNEKLLITHGFGCGVSYGAGEAPPVFGASGTGLPGVETGDVAGEALARGFAVGSTALDNNSHNCNIAVQGEALMMLKERIVETRGPLRYTIATGCSGGAVVQQQIANAYPGIYQGLTPQCSYPDTFSPGTQFADYHMLRLYFEDPVRWGVPWIPTQFGQVEGHVSHVNAITADEGLFKSAIDPAYPCDGVTEEQRFHPQDNPDGVRCDVLSYMINVLGPRPKRDWTRIERELGRGFAGVPFSNEGIQYGLQALRDGQILPAQFVDLNVKIGGLSLFDFSPTEKRLEADPAALRNAYRSGAFNEANNLEKVAIINLGGPDPGAAHDYSHAFFMRARLLREQGHLDNYVMWFGPAPILGSTEFGTEALIEMDRWLAAVEADDRKLPLEEKIAEDRPADLVDRCEVLPTAPLPGPVCDVPLVQTRFGTPRTVAGDGIASDTSACRLKPLDRADDYGTIPFTDAQWKQLEAVFPDGVCDWSKPGRGQRDTIAWLGYGDRDDVVYGGRRLGKAPPRSGGGWTSRAFGDWTNPPRR